MIFGWSGDAVQLKADNPNIEFVLPEEGVHAVDGQHADPGRRAARVTRPRSSSTTSTTPRSQAQIAAYVNYVCPVKGVKEVLEKTDPKLAENQLIFPDPDSRQRPHLQRRSQPDEEREIDDAFQQRDRRVGAEPRELDDAGARAPERRALPYLLLAPGPAVAGCSSSRVPLVLHGARVARDRARSSRASSFTWEFSNYTDAISNYDEQFIRSFEYAGLATLIALADRLPARVRDRVPRREVAERAAAARDPAVLRHLPDPHALVGDDPVDSGVVVSTLQVARDRSARTAACSPPRSPWSRASPTTSCRS